MARQLPLPQLKQIMGKPITPVDIGTFAAILHAARNRFFRVVWESNQNKRLKKTGPGAAYKGREVTKLYVMTARNDYSFRNSVKAELERRGFMLAAAEFQVQERKWGRHIDHTPFVVHQVEERDGTAWEPERLYGHFLPAINPHTGRKAYHDIPGETGYYVDGDKANDAELRALEYERKAPETETDKARAKVHPVNARLDDVLYFKVAGQWYRLRVPTYDEIESLADAAVAYSEKIEAALAAA